MKIGLSYTGNEAKHNNYVQWLKADDDIEIVKLSSGEKDKDLIDQCDALVLSGGLDMHPRFYKGNAEYPFMPEKGFNPERDEFELLLLRNALKNSIPVLGICRGLQLINIYYEGTLVQHLNEDKILHQGSPDKKHIVNIEEGTLLYDIAGVRSEAVNSAHHQSIGKLGSGLAENSRSEDGIIEGIEWSDKNNKPFMLAVQWHPERMKKFNLQHSPLSKNIRDRFIAETTLNLKKR